MLEVALPPLFMLQRPHITADLALSPMHEYEKLVERGVLRPDEHQTRIIQKLEDLHDALAKYNPPSQAAFSSLSIVRHIAFVRGSLRSRNSYPAI